MSHETIFQGRLPRVTPHASQHKIALQVAEKVEAAFTFRNDTQQVGAWNTPTATCLAIFFEKEPITIRHNQNAADIFK